jgi:hypothetical protein
MSDTTPTPTANPTGNNDELCKDQDQDHTMSSMNPTIAMNGTQQVRKMNGNRQGPNHWGDWGPTPSLASHCSQDGSWVLSASSNRMVSDYYQPHPFHKLEGFYFILSLYFISCIILGDCKPGTTG